MQQGQKLQNNSNSSRTAAAEVRNVTGKKKKKKMRILLLRHQFLGYSPSAASRSDESSFGKEDDQIRVQMMFSHFISEFFLGICTYTKTYYNYPGLYCIYFICLMFDVKYDDIFDQLIVV